MWFLLLLIPLLLLLKKIMQVKGPKMLLPPSPPKLPIIGNLHQLGALPHQSYMKLSQKYGPVMLLKFGRIPFVIISSAEAAREVLKVHDLDSCSRAQLTGSRKLTYNYLDIAFAPYGDHWRQIRKISVLELFSTKRVQSFRFVREEEVALLMNSLSQSAASNTPVDLSEKIFALTGSITFRTAFGQKFRGSNLEKQFEKVVRAAESVVGGFTTEECFPYVGWIVDRLNGYHAKLEKVFRQLDTFYQKAIDDHLKPERRIEDQEDIIDVMLNLQRHQTKSDEAHHLASDQIKGVLLDLFLGGVDTSAITVIWAMTELVRKPRLMKKAQDEVRNCVGKKERVEEDYIDQLPYLKMIIKETLRLHPPAPLLLPRQTISHFKVCGYDIPPKTSVQVNVWAIGRDPKYWKNPEEFNPERFMDSSIDYKGQHYELLPFGSGRRSCPGMNMGLMTAELALANLLYCFNWKLPNGMKEEDVNMEESCGVSLNLSKRTAVHLVPVNYL